MTKYFIGTSGWTYDSWRGRFYPKQLAKSKWLEYYTQIFNTVEINATFYRAFERPTFKKWYDQAPKNFKYIVKVPRYISHMKMLKDSEHSIARFEKSAHWLKEKLGLMLLQLPHRAKYNLERMHHILETFKNPHELVVEIRNERWLTEEFHQLLKSYKTIFCSVDSPEMSPIDWLTAKKAYIRLHGHRFWYNDQYTSRELKNIAEFAKKLSERGAKEIYIYFNNDYFAYAPKNALALRELLSE